MTRSLQDMPSFTHELLEHHLIGETSKKRQEGKQPKAHKHKKYGYQLFKDKRCLRLKLFPMFLKG